MFRTSISSRNTPNRVIKYAVLLVVVILLSISGSIRSTEMTSPQIDATAQLSELEWMAGLWGGVVDGVWQEEYWLAPRGGMMVGVHRDVSSSGRVLFEYMRIEATEEGLIYYASPRGRAPATPFKLREQGDQRIVFENPRHNFPQVIEYWRDDETLNAQIEGTSSGGEVQLMAWSWPRIDGE